MPVVPNWIERTIFLSLNQGPGLDIWNAVAFRSVSGLSYFHLLEGNLYAFNEVAR